MPKDPNLHDALAGYRARQAFEGRFRSALIETDGDLLACQCDIELNPVRKHRALC